MVDCHHVRMSIGQALERVPAAASDVRACPNREVTEHFEAIPGLTLDEARTIEIDNVEDPDVFLRWMHWRIQCRKKLLQ